MPALPPALPLDPLPLPVPLWLAATGAVGGGAVGGGAVGGGISGGVVVARGSNG